MAATTTPGEEYVPMIIATSPQNNTALMIEIPDRTMSLAQSKHYLATANDYDHPDSFKVVKTIFSVDFGSFLSEKGDFEDDLIIHLMPHYHYLANQIYLALEGQEFSQAVRNSLMVMFPVWILALLVEFFPEIEAKCVIRQKVSYCQDHVNPGQIPAGATSIIFASVSPTSCFTAAKLKGFAPLVRFIKAKHSAHLCNCLLGSRVPCGITIDGCSTSSLTGICRAESESTGTGTVTIVLSTLGVLFLVILIVIMAICYYGYRKRMGEYDRRLRDTVLEMGSISQATERRNRSDAELIDLDTTTSHPVDQQHASGGASGDSSIEINPHGCLRPSATSTPKKGVTIAQIEKQP